MQERDLRVIRRFKELVSRRLNLQEIRIFGSRARGEGGEYSDLDVFLVVDYLDHSLEKYISECAWEAGFPEDVVIIPISVTLSALKNSPIRESVFVKNVYREGIPV